MARLWSSGGELNSETSGMEFGSTTGSTTALSTATVRSGTYSMQATATGTTAAVFAYQYLASTTQGDYYYRFYFRVASLPASTVYIWSVGRFNGGYESNVEVRITSTGALRLYNSEDSAQVGSDSSALSLNQWYLVELRVNTTTLASTAVDLKIDGSSVASGTINLADANDRLQFGCGSAVACDFFFDDVAINDSSGSFQNSWSGAGNIIHLRPNADGDNQGWSGTATPNAYTDVDEVTPDDATSIRTSTTATTDDFNIDSPTALGASDTINVVSVGVRYAVDVTGGTTADVVVRCMATSGGTVEEGTSWSLISTSYNTNASGSTAKNPRLVMYDLPGASTTAWTKSDLETAQIGIRQTSDPTNTARYSALWMLVDYTPVAGTAQDTNAVWFGAIL